MGGSGPGAAEVFNWKRGRAPASGAANGALAVGFPTRGAPPDSLSSWVQGSARGAPNSSRGGCAPYRTTMDFRARQTLAHSSNFFRHSPFVIRISPSFLHRHDEVGHDVVLPLGRVFAHVKTQD